MLYERWGDNRSYKSAFNAHEAYLQYRQGKIVYCNCQCQCDGKEPWLCQRCVLLFPHSHLSPLDPDFGQKELYHCCIVTDQTESSGLDSRTHMSVATREAGYFTGQAKKAGVDWFYDAIRHRRLDITVRQATDWYIHHIRIPPLQKVWYDAEGNYHDWPSAVAVKLRILHRDSVRPKYFTYYRPFLEKLHKLYRTQVQIRPVRRSEPLNVPAIHKQLVAP